jgi:hypothetical protein
MLGYLEATRCRNRKAQTGKFLAAIVIAVVIVLAYAASLFSGR